LTRKMWRMQTRTRRKEREEMGETTVMVKTGEDLRTRMRMRMVRGSIRLPRFR